MRPRSIEFYEPPVDAALAANKVTWEADGRQAAVLIHDLQNYWIEPFERPESMVDRGLGDRHVRPRYRALRRRVS